MFFPSRMPCAHCGAALESDAAGGHTCDPARRMDFQLLAMRPAIDAFENDLRTFLSGNEGRFEAWLAALKVRGAA